MTDKVKFLRELAELMNKHNVALCSEGGAKRFSSNVFFMANLPFAYNAADKIRLGRHHSTAYEIGIIANEIERSNALRLIADFKGDGNEE